MKRTVAVILSRMNSSRLPGKALKILGKKNVLEILIARLSLASMIDEIVVATSTSIEDTKIEDFCRRLRVKCFRGDENDVQKRLIDALEFSSAEVGVTIYGDCPLIDPIIVDKVIKKFHESDYDFVGNNLKTTFPPGMEVEAFKVEALKDAQNKSSDPTFKEHATLFLRQHPKVYRQLNIEAEGEERRPELEIELDTEEDFYVLSSIVKHFSDRNDYTLKEVINYLDENQELINLNSKVHRRWKQFRNDGE